MAKNSYNPKPGPQQPGKYPFTGPNYERYGEQPGFIYFPYTDTYKPDPKQVQDYGEQTGLIQKEKKEGLSDLVVPLAATAGTIYGAQTLMPELIGSSKEGTGLIGLGKDAFGFGKPTAPTNPVAGSGTAPSAAPSSAPSGDGLVGLGGGGSTPPATPDVISATRVMPQTIPAGAPVPSGFTAVGTSGDGGVMIVPDKAIAPDGGINFSAAAQGLLGAAQLYQGYKAYKDGDYLGAGIMGGSGALGVGAAFGSEMAASALPYAAPIAGAYGAYQTAKMIGSSPAGGRRNSMGALGGATSGAAIGSVVPGVGTAAGALIGGLVGLGASMFGSDKDKYQMIRDQGRKSLQQNGILDKDWMGTLADGSKFDFGKDGKGFKKFDYNDPNTGRVISLANVIAAAEGAYGRSKDAMAMLYTSAALSNAGGDYNKALANIKHFAAQRGFNQQNVTEQLTKMKEAGQIDENEYNVFTAEANTIFGNTPAPAGGGTSSQPPRSQTTSPGMKNGNVIQLDTSGRYKPKGKPVPMPRGGGLIGVGRG